MNNVVSGRNGKKQRRKTEYNCGRRSANGGIKGGRLEGKQACWPDRIGKRRMALIFRSRRIYVGELVDVGTKALGIAFSTFEIGARGARGARGGQEVSKRWPKCRRCPSCSGKHLISRVLRQTQFDRSSRGIAERIDASVIPHSCRAPTRTRVPRKFLQAATKRSGLSIK